jgi:predicted dehydrogenase
MSSFHPVANRRPELNWRFNRPAGGGVTFDIGCYCINHARWMFGTEPEMVHAIGRWGDASGVDEHVVGHAQFPDGRTFEWCVSWHAGPAHMAEMIGTAGTIRLARAWGIDETGPLQIEISEGRDRIETIDFPHDRQFALQLAHMKHCLETGQPHRLPMSDSIAQMRVIDAVYASLRTGAPVAVATNTA